MTLHASARAPARPGFTLVELLVALALIVFIMSILSEAFAAAAVGFRDLKAAGDLQEELRGTATNLRRDLDEANFEAASVVSAGLRGSVDRDRIADLRKRYKAIATDAAKFDARLLEVEPMLESPADRRIVRRVRGSLGSIKLTATATAGLLVLFDPDDDK